MTAPSKPKPPYIRLTKKARELKGYYTVAVKRDGKLSSVFDTATMEEAQFVKNQAEAAGHTATIGHTPPRP